MKQLLFLLCCLFLVNGCMPMWVHNYYSPSAEGGTVTKSTCRKSIGPPNRFEIIKDDVIIGIEAFEGVIIDINIEVPAGKTVRLRNSIVDITSTSISESASGNVVPLIPYGGVQWQINEDMIGGTTNYKLFFGGTRTDYNIYSLRAKIPFPKSDVVKVKLPIVTINGKNYILSDVTFTKDIFFEFFMPINC